MSVNATIPRYRDCSSLRIVLRRLLILLTMFQKITHGDALLRQQHLTLKVDETIIMLTLPTYTAGEAGWIL